jgi:beta-lactam-binding protein with PASTA domain
VPNVVGTSSSAAALVLAKACLNAIYANPVGSPVISEAPVAGSNVSEHSTVTLTTR